MCSVCSCPTLLICLCACIYGTTKASSRGNSTGCPSLAMHYDGNYCKSDGIKRMRKVKPCFSSYFGVSVDMAGHLSSIYGGGPSSVFV